MEITSEMVNWLARGERGLSSNTLFSKLTGVDTRPQRWSSRENFHPWDPEDLGRCRKLLEACPELKSKLTLMADVSSAWAVLVEAWDELCTMMDEEAPRWREAVGTTPKTYKRMCKLLGRPGEGEKDINHG